MTLVLPLAQLTSGAKLVIGEDEIAGGVWFIPPGAPEPTSFIPFTSGALELAEAGTGDGATVAGSFSGVFGESNPERAVEATGKFDPSAVKSHIVTT